MADLGDMASEIEREHLAAALQRSGETVLTGAPGVCGECGHWFARLVDGQCGFCRDGRLPPDDWEPATPPDWQRPPTLVERVIARHEPFAPPPTPSSQPKEETSMSESSKITITGAALAAVRARADAKELTLTQATDDLIVLGAGGGGVIVEVPTPIALADIHLDALLDEVKRRADASNDATDQALGEAVARAEAAEARLDRIQSALAA